MSHLLDILSPGSGALCVAVLTFLCAGPTLAAPPAPWQKVIPAEDYSRCSLIDPNSNGEKPADATVIPRIKASHALAGEGWVDYDFSVPQAGWYQVGLGKMSVTDHDFYLDGDIHVYGGVTDNVTNAWLAAGQHTLRVQRLTWTGLAGIHEIVIRQSDGSAAESLRIDVPGDRLVLRKGERLNLDVYGGGRQGATNLTAWVKTVADDRIMATDHLEIPASAGLLKRSLSIPCAQEGIFYVAFGDGIAPISPTDVREIQFVVIDTTPRLRPGGEIHKTLLREIDCSAEPPAGGFWSGGGETRVVKTAFGSYRESGDHGYLQKSADPSFFAYALDVPEAQQPYVIQVDYPDDDLRTFCIGLEERSMMDYPPAGGVDSGGCYSLSHRMQTQTFIHWPRGKELRVLFFNAQNGRRAAAARIRLYRVDGDLPALDVPVNGGRSFGYWLEEGDRWATFQGAPDKSLSGYLVSMKRWADAAAYMGADTLDPTLAIYQNVLYPSKFYNGYFRPTGGPRDPAPLDVTRMLLLVCERYGLKLLPDFHPTWNGYKRLVTDMGPYQSDPNPKPNLMVASDGAVGDGPFRPYFNPIYPANEKWYVGMVGEFVDRYKDSPALQGVDLRVMGWAWESWNGWPSIHWGYDDYTVGLFEKETGIHVPVPVDAPDRFHQRYLWLTTHEKGRWIAWRCEKLTDLYRRLAERVQQARPGLKVCSAVHGPQLDMGYYPGDAYLQKCDRDGLKECYTECGYDISQLCRLPGVMLLNAQFYYGRRSLYGEVDEQRLRDYLLDPAAMTVFQGPTGGVGYLYSNSYFEANQVVIPQKMGLAGVKPTGFVGVVNPAGRHYLERYALSLADGDASLILDGGEGYLLGQGMYLRDFLAEYRRLPPVRFTPRPDATDPVAVWELKRRQNFLFYAVNRERYPVQVTLRMGGSGAIRHLATGEVMNASGGILRLDLKSYQLMAFTCSPNRSVAQVTETIPDADSTSLKTQVDWLTQLAEDVHDKRAGTGLDAWTAGRLASMSAEAAASFKEGHYWRARTLLENHVLLAVYEAVNRFPPDLRELRAPAVPSTALRVEDLARLAGPDAHVFVSESVSPDWTGDQILATSAPAMQIAMPVPVSGRYQLTLGHAAGGAYGPLEGKIAGIDLGTTEPDPTGPQATETRFNPVVALPEGTSSLVLRRTAGSQTAVS
jgi:hypothetical protein